MKKIFNYLTLFLLPLLITSCGEELVSKGTLSDSITTQGVVTMSSEDCGGFHYEKPPVDILFVIDNSGSTNNSRFNQIRAQIGNTISTISQDFDYHIYVAPLFKGPESNKSYPLLVSDPGSIDSEYTINITTIENLPAFPARGNNLEPGIDRVKELINANKSINSSQNKVFRKNSNLIAVMISTGDDNSFCEPGLGNCAHPSSQTLLMSKINSLFSLKTNLDSQIFRFISLVPFSNCSPFKNGYYYRQVSANFYNRQSLTDDNTYKDSRDLCSGNYASLFQAVNNSIQKVLVGHKYNHWVINPNDVPINENNIDLKKKLANGTLISLSANSTNGFELLSALPGHNSGYRENFDILELPADRQELKTGLIVKLNGSAKVTYPECIIAKTKSPTEYYGYVVLSRKPDLATVQVKINGNEISESMTNGWKSYNNNEYTPNQNIKIVGPTSGFSGIPGGGGGGTTGYDYSPAFPALIQSGYVLKMYGTAVYSNSDTIDVYYKPADL